MTLKKIIFSTLFVCLLIIGSVNAVENNYQDKKIGDININVSPQINVVNQNTNPVNVNSPTVTKITKIFAIKKIFNINTKIKKYSITLKTNNEPAQNKIATLKIKGKTYKAKTNNNGKATFKITNLKKKGTYKGIIRYNGTKKIVKIIVK